MQGFSSRGSRATVTTASSDDQVWPPADLSLVLKRLMATCRRATDAGRQRLANDDLTREYLEAGIRLMMAQFEAAGQATDGEAETREGRPFFEWISRSLLTKEVSRQLSNKTTSGSFRDRWGWEI